MLVENPRLQREKKRAHFQTALHTSVFMSWTAFLIHLSALRRGRLRQCLTSIACEIVIRDVLCFGHGHFGTRFGGLLKEMLSSFGLPVVPLNFIN